MTAPITCQERICWLCFRTHLVQIDPPEDDHGHCTCGMSLNNSLTPAQWQATYGNSPSAMRQRVQA